MHRNPHLRLLKPYNSFIYGAFISVRVAEAAKRLKNEGM